jgi:hypothetical protein
MPYESAYPIPVFHRCLLPLVSLFFASPSSSCTPDFADGYVPLSATGQVDTAQNHGGAGHLL